MKHEGYCHTSTTDFGPLTTATVDPWPNSTSLPVSSGGVLLRNDEPGSLPSRLDAISAAGCQCSILHERLTPTFAEAWRQQLRPGKQFRADVFLPNCPAARAVVRVLNVRDEAAQSRLELSFDSAENLEQLLASAYCAARGRLKPTECRGLNLLQILRSMGKLTSAACNALRQRGLAGARLKRHLLRESLISSADYAQARALQTRYPYADLSGAEADSTLLSALPAEVLRRFYLLPFDQAEKVLCVAAAEPPASSLLRQLELSCGRSIMIFLADERRIAALLRSKSPRRHPREDCACRLQLRRAEFHEEAAYEGLAGNISRSGFMFECADDLGLLGSAFEFELTLPSGTVRGRTGLRHWQPQDNFSRPWRGGGEILALDGAAQHLLNDFFSSIEARRNPPQ